MRVTFIIFRISAITNIRGENNQMIAQCPTCEARYRVDDSKVSPGGTKFKCKKCKNTFTVFREFRQQEHEAPVLRAPTTKNCPHCGKPIPFQAIKCRYCREPVEKAETTGFEAQEAGAGEGEGEGHQDPFVPQGGPGEDHQDPFVPQGGPGADHQDPFVPQGAGGYSGADAFDEDDSFGGGAPGYGGPEEPGGGGFSDTGALAPGTSAAFGRPITGKKISPLLFALPLWLGAIVAGIGSVMAGSGSKAFGGLLDFAGNISVFFATIYGLIALYRVWYVIPDAYARTTPGKAVGFMFIPLFNFYWVFVAFAGLAEDAQNFLNRAGVMEEKISRGLSQAYSILFLVSQIIPFVGIALIVSGSLVIGMTVYIIYLLAALVLAIIGTIIVFKWADFNSYVLDNPGQFAKLHSGTARTTNAIVLFIVFGVFVGIAVLGILAAILIPAFIAARGY